MIGFDNLFKKHVKKTDYKFNPDLGYGENENRLIRMATLEHTCKMLYNQLAKIYGEDYAEYLVERVLTRDFRITAPDKFPFKEFTHMSEKVFLNKLINDPYPSKTAYPILVNLTTLATSLFTEIISKSQKSGEVEIMDFFICLGLAIEQWRQGGYSPDVLGGKSVHRENFLRSELQHVILSMFAPKTELQHITLAILDKTLFDELMKCHEYYIPLLDSSKRGLSATTIKASYDIYIEGVREYFRILKYSIRPYDKSIQPKIKIYAYTSNKIRSEVLELISERTRISASAVQDIFQHVHFDAHPQWVDSPEYREAIAEIVDLTYRDDDINVQKLKSDISIMFKTDYLNYLNIVDKRLAYTIKDSEITEVANNIEEIYVKRQWKSGKTFLRKTYSEVTIDSKFLMKDCRTVEELEEKIYKALLDAQAINYARALMLSTGLDYRGNIKVPKIGVIYNVKLEGLEDDYISTAYTAMDKATTYLKSTYGQQLDFTFEISQRVYFRDKTRKCYELL